MRLNWHPAICDRCGANSGKPVRDGSRTVPEGWIAAKIRIGDPKSPGKVRKARFLACCMSCLNRLIEGERHPNLRGKGLLDSTLRVAARRSRAVDPSFIERVNNWPEQSQKKTDRLLGEANAQSRRNEVRS